MFMAFVVTMIVVGTAIVAVWVIIDAFWKINAALYEGMLWLLKLCGKILYYLILGIWVLFDLIWFKIKSRFI